MLLWFSLNPDSISTSISLLAFIYLWKMFSKSGSFDLWQLLTFEAILALILEGGLVAWFLGVFLSLLVQSNHNVTSNFVSHGDHSSVHLSEVGGDWGSMPKQSLKDQWLIFEGVKIRSNSWITFHICANIDPTESGLYLQSMKLSLPLNCYTSHNLVIVGRMSTYYVLKLLKLRFYYHK